MTKLRFNNKIYKKEAIKEAISVYSSLAKIELKEASGYIEVSIQGKIPDNLPGEFCNYALGKTKQCL